MRSLSVAFPDIVERVEAYKATTEAGDEKISMLFHFGNDTFSDFTTIAKSNPVTDSKSAAEKKLAPIIHKHLVDTIHQFS